MLYISTQPYANGFWVYANLYKSMRLGYLNLQNPFFENFQNLVIFESAIFEHFLQIVV